MMVLMCYMIIINSIKSYFFGIIELYLYYTIE